MNKLSTNWLYYHVTISFILSPYRLTTIILKSNKKCVAKYNTNIFF